MFTLGDGEFALDRLGDETVPAKNRSDVLISDPAKVHPGPRSGVAILQPSEGPYRSCTHSISLSIALGDRYARYTSDLAPGPWRVATGPG